MHLPKTQASPQQDSLPCGLVTLLRAAADASEDTAQHKPSKAAKQAASADGTVEAAQQQQQPSEWLMDLAMQLSLQVRVLRLSYVIAALCVCVCCSCVAVLLSFVCMWPARVCLMCVHV